MLAKWQVTVMDNLLRMLMDDDSRPFGGKPVLFGGDMAQILPVMKESYVGDVISHSLVSWEHWSERTSFTLQHNMRAHRDPEFAEWVSRVRDGSANIDGGDDIIVPERMLVKPPKKRKGAQGNYRAELDAHMDAMVEKVFTRNVTAQTLAQGALLAPVNTSQRELNMRIVNKLQGGSDWYSYSTTKMVHDGGEAPGFIVTQEDLNRLSPSNLPPHTLHLKVGAVVMLLLNMNKKQGLCNGTRFGVTRLNRHAICLKRLVPFRGQCEEIYIPRMHMRSDAVPVVGIVERYQFPVCLAAAMTINKAQGQTIKKVGLFLEKPVFSHGQFYVAVSRGETFDSVYVSVVDGNQQGSGNGKRGGRQRANTTKTRNIVIRQLLE